MKTKIAVALSVVGVLGAGSAAALVNTQILESGPGEAGASAAVLPPASPVDVTVPPVTADPPDADATTVRVQTPRTTPSPSSSSPTTTSAKKRPRPSGQLTAFNVGDAGVVTVDVVRDRLVLVSAEPRRGWQIRTSEEDRDENKVEVVFVSNRLRVEFEAELVDGEIVPEVDSSPVRGSRPSTPAATPAPPATRPAVTRPPVTAPDDDDHDDDDDDYGDDDHDDDDDDDDDYDDDHDDDDDDDDDREDD